MTSPRELRLQAERCRLVGTRYGDPYRSPMQRLAQEFDAEAETIDAARSEAFMSSQGGPAK